jgi:hypothetical protein
VAAGSVTGSLSTSGTTTNPKVLTVGGRAGGHLDLIVFMRSDGSVASCAL